MTALRVRFLIFLVATIAAIWSLVPTYTLHVDLPRRFAALEKERASLLASADTAGAAGERAAMVRSQLLALDHKYAELQQERSRTSRNALHLGLDIVGGMHLVLTLSDTIQMPTDRVAEALQGDLKVIEGRIDRLGVVEPVLQHTGDRLIVQLPGVVDEARAESLIGKTAVLDFRMLADDRKTEELVNRVDNLLKEQQRDDSSQANPPSFRNYITSAGGDLAIDEQYFPIVSGMLAQLDTSHILGDYRFFFGPREKATGGDVRRLYLLKREPELSTADGKLIDKAFHRLYTGTDDPQAANTFVVDFTLSRTPNPKYNPVTKFASVTGRYVGKRLAIVLDSVVQSAPTIRIKIPDGAGMITTGDVAGDKARDLAIVLATGALQAPLKVESAERIGPSLGADSIRRGVRASLAGAALVVLFMLTYYNLSGVIAVVAMLMNTLYLFAILGGVLHATLTLPGLAALALTLGMSVDANVLIFERIREELRWGKSVRAAIENGYSRAMTAIIDGNLTTIISSVALYFMGSGPIRGFATNLVIGLIINVVTAVYFTRMVYDFALSQFQVKTLRI
ncbi:MAG: protein translocase subunit SecD [candidate division WOR-3 bacterium]